MTTIPTPTELMENLTAHDEEAQATTEAHIVRELRVRYDGSHKEFRFRGQRVNDRVARKVCASFHARGWHCGYEHGSEQREGAWTDYCLQAKDATR